MKRCWECGTTVTPLKPNVAWTSIMRCDECGLRYQVYHADAMSGAGEDVVEQYRHPFKNEEVLTLPKE